MPKGNNISEERKKRVIEIAKDNPDLKHEAIAKRMGMSRRTVGRIIKERENNV